MRGRTGVGWRWDGEAAEAGAPAGRGGPAGGGRACPARAQAAGRAGAGREAPTPGRGGVGSEFARLQARVVGSDAWLARVEDSVVVLVNEARRRHRLPALRTDERLRTAARPHSADMRDRSYLAHDAPDGRSPDDRMRAAGYRQPASENIAVGYPTPHAVLQAWLRSPGHRANIVDPRFRAIGVGVARGDGGPWWTQDLGHE